MAGGGMTYKEAFDAVKHFGFGIAGLIQKDRKRVFPILGLVLNLAITIALVGIIVLGMIAF